MDSWLITNIGNNIITITIALTVLKGLAEISPWSWDEKVIDVIHRAISSFTERRNK